MQTLGYVPVVCKHLWIIVKSTGGKNNGHNLLRFSMVVVLWMASKNPEHAWGLLILYYCFQRKFYQWGFPEGGGGVRCVDDMNACVHISVSLSVYLITCITFVHHMIKVIYGLSVYLVTCITFDL